jgi:hypothetical protein
MARATAHVRSFWKFFHFNQFPRPARKNCHPVLSSRFLSRVFVITISSHLKPVTDEQVYMTSFQLWQFSLFGNTTNFPCYYWLLHSIDCWPTACKYSTKLLCQIFFVDPYRQTKFVLCQFFLCQVHSFKN